jgi:hypothetical protein
MSEALLRQLVTAAHGPDFYCCRCLAHRLETDEPRVRAMAQMLLVHQPARFVTEHRACAGCSVEAPIVMRAQ